MTRQRVIAKFYDDLEAAERYKDKQMDPTPIQYPVTFLLGQVVKMRLDPAGDLGHIVCIELHQNATLYVVSWPHLLVRSPHCDFELELVEPPA